MNRKRRSKLEIVFEILKVIGKKGVKPTHLMYKTYLSHALLKKYIEELTKRGRIIGKEKNYLMLTTKGEKQIKSMKKAFKIIKLNY